MKKKPESKKQEKKCTEKLKPDARSVTSTRAALWRKLGLGLSRKVKRSRIFRQMQGAGKGPREGRTGCRRKDPCLPAVL